MKFKTEYDSIVYCKDEYCKELDDTDAFYYSDIKRYYNGYLLHRKDGPAVEWKDGSKFWYLEGQRHREDGPAQDFYNGFKNWYLNGINYSEEEYLRIMNLKNKRKILNDI